jgi:hypothetical protein
LEIQAQLIANYHRFTTQFLLLGKPFECVRLVITDFKFLNSGALLIGELNQEAFWILSPCHANLSLRVHQLLQTDKAGRVVKNSYK